MMATNMASVILLLVLLLRFSSCVDIITTIAGSNTQGYSGDNGAATAAALYYPTGLALDSSGIISVFFYLLKIALPPLIV
jgi:hypothetical protein